jgi:hypothetical protein
MNHLLIITDNEKRDLSSLWLECGSTPDFTFLPKRNERLNVNNLGTISTYIIYDVVWDLVIEKSLLKTSKTMYCYLIVRKLNE